MTPQTKLVPPNNAIGMDVDAGNSVNASACRQAQAARAMFRPPPNNNTPKLNKVTLRGRLGFELARTEGHPLGWAWGGNELAHASSSPVRSVRP